MTRGRYSYLDLTVQPEMRPHVVARNGAIVFTPDLSRVLWANGEGARLLGAPALRGLLEEDFRPGDTIMRQIRPSVERLGADDRASAMLRARTGIKTSLIGFTVQTIDLPGGDAGILLVSEDVRGRAHGDVEMAQTAVEALDGYGHASAIIDAGGAVIAASSRFEKLDVGAEILQNLIDEVAGEEDRLVKRRIETGQGTLAAGIARIADEPAMHLLIIAGESDAESEPQPKSVEESAKPVAAHAHASGQAQETTETAELPETAPPETEPDTASASEAEAAEEDRPSSEIDTDHSTSGGDSEIADSGPPQQKVPSRWFYRGSLGGDAERPGKPEPHRKAEEGIDQDGDGTQAAESNGPVSDPIAASGLVRTVEFSGPDIDDGEAEPAIDATEEGQFAEALEDGGDGFRFTSDARPARFVWSMNPDKVFTSVSRDLANAVGPHCADLEGMSWRAVAERFGFDQNGSIEALLGKGDTWSGKTVLWPVEGTDLHVPVDLAGLPAFGKSRSFEGFNGFGIVRTADAMVDPEERGLNFGAEFPGAEAQEQEEWDERQTLPPAEDAGDYVGEADDGAAGEDDGKIVQLSELRDTRRKELTSEEREAFDEIADTLRAEEPAPDPAGPADETDTGAEEEKTGEDGAEDDEFREIDPDAYRRGDDEPLDYVTRRNRELEDIVAKARNVRPPKAEPKPRPPESRPGFIPSAFAGRRADDRAGTVSAREVDTSILSRLPIPVLVYRDDDLLFANEEFFATTGYASLSQLEASGGLDALFGGETSEAAASQSTVFHREGRELDVSAHLQRVPWDDRRAMLLTLRKNEGRGGSDGGGSGDRDGNGPEPSGELNDKPAEPGQEQSKVASITSLDTMRGGPDHPLGGLGNEDLRNILDTATDGVMVLNGDGTIRSINASAQALFDVNAADVRGSHFTSLLAPESHLLADDYLSGLSGNGVASVLNDGREVIGRVTGGGLIPLFMTLGRLGGSGGYCAVMRDITHWKKAEEELVAARSEAENANAMKSEFLAKISHEIRTPLNAIIGFSDMMIEERFGKLKNARYREYLEDIRNSGQHVLELVNDLLDISKIEAGKVELDFGAVSLNAIVTKAVALTQPQANKGRIIIRTSVSAAVPKVVADPKSIRQIVLNLVSNAIKFTSAGGQVIVSTVYEQSGEVVLRVRDTGVGMSESEIATAMKPFHQINALVKPGIEGTGLGLPLTKAMVEANRARFSIDSTPGKGTLIEIRFPPQRVLAD